MPKTNDAMPEKVGKCSVCSGEVRDVLARWRHEDRANARCRVEGILSSIVWSDGYVAPTGEWLKWIQSGLEKAS